MSIKTIQKSLKTQNIFGEIITLNNLFITEAIRDDENQIKQLTGFSGSNALLFITQQKSYLFTDSRYTLQAQKEVNLKQIEIIIQEKSLLQTLIDFLKKQNLTPNHTITYNPWCLSPFFVTNLQNQLPNISLTQSNTSSYNLTPSIAKTFSHIKKFSGSTTKEKIDLFVKFIKKQKLDSFLITSPANSSWLINMRSNALEFSPIFRAYVLVNKDKTYKIFANSTDYPQALPLETLEHHLKPIKKLGLDFNLTPIKILDFNYNIQNLKDPITELKSIKNKTELEGTKEAHIRDGVAITKFLYWLSQNYTSKTELDISNKLTSFKKEEKNYYSNSFNTISAFGSNGAIVHYTPTPKTNKTLKKGSLLLLDSGTQYYDGTTDITRTIAIGTPTDEMKEKYTLVLKSHIALSSAIFPEKTSGEKLDILSRNILLKHNLNYAHGTGHGVGHFSNVHEGPNNISLTSNTNVALKKSMITSIEPGFYKENHYGIRIENLYYITQYQKTKHLCFKPLTLVPFDKNLINPTLLTNEEKDYINTYHKEVLKSLKKHLSKLELEWLKNQTTPI